MNKRYPGLKPFTKDEKNIFFGRENDIRRLLSLLFVRKIVVLFSKSGLGKSSLLNAGLIPQLAKPHELLVFSFRPGRYSTENPTSLINVFAGQLESSADLNKDGSTLREKLIAIYDRELAKSGKKVGFVLVFDQFEEVFSHPPLEIYKFKKEFAALINAKLPESLKAQVGREFPSVHIIISTRGDKFDHLSRLTDDIPDIFYNTFELGALDIDGAKEAITRPAQLNGVFASQKFSFDDNCVESILNYLYKSHGEIQSNQLQIICEYAEEKVIEKTKQNQTNKDDKGETVIVLDDLGDLENIFDEYYDKEIKKLPFKYQRLARRLIEDGLIHEKDEVRLPLYKKTILDVYKIPQDVLGQLVDLKLLKEENDFYEIPHDTLIKPIIKSKAKRKSNFATRSWAGAVGAILIIGTIITTVLLSKIWVSDFVFDETASWVSTLSDSERSGLKEELSSASSQNEWANILRSFKLLAESKIMINNDPDLAFRLAFTAEQLRNRFATEFINSSIAGRHAYARKYELVDNIAGLEYRNGATEIFNSRNSYYRVKPGNGYIYYSPEDRIDINLADTDTSKRHYRFYSRQGNFIITVEDSLKVVQRINRDNNSTESLKNTDQFYNSPFRIAQVEISPLGNTWVVVTRNAAPKSLSRIYVMKTSGETLLGQKTNIEIAESVNYIYFCDYRETKTTHEKKDAKGIVLVLNKGLAIIHLDEAGKVESSSVFRYNAPIIGASYNPISGLHTFTTLDNKIFVLGDEAMFKSMNSFQEASQLYPVTNQEAVLNATTLQKGSGKYLAFVTRSTIQNEANTATNLYISPLKSTKTEVESLRKWEIEEPEDTISWPGYAPVLVHSSVNDGKLLTAGVHLSESPDPKKRWYVYEWEVGPSHITREKLTAPGYLRDLTIDEKIRYEFASCSEFKEKKDAAGLLSCGIFYKDLFLADPSSVFSYRPHVARDPKKDNHDVDSLLQISQDYLKIYFEVATDPDSIANTYSTYLELCSNMDAISGEKFPKHLEAALNLAEDLSSRPSAKRELIQDFATKWREKQSETKYRKNSNK